jgi:hypothetical protein
MRNIVGSLLLTCIPLLADFYPPTMESSVASANQKSLTLSRPLPVSGMSGAIVHRFAPTQSAITGYLRYEGGRNGVLVDNEPITHEELPSVKQKAHAGDKVIGGYLYNTILILAPDADSYARIVESAEKNWIHPDLYAMFLSREGDQVPTKENLQQFANEYQIGLVYIVQKNRAVLYDPISRKIVAQKPASKLPAKGQFPFFMRLDKIESGWFSKDAKGEYYQLAESIR